MVSSVGSSEVKRVLTLIAQTIVDEPAEVRVDAETSENETLIRLRVAPQDVSTVLGTDGTIGHSLRDLLAEMGVKYKHRFALNIAGTDIL